MELYEDKIFHLMSEKAPEIQELWKPKAGDKYTYYQGSTGFAGGEIGQVFKIYLESDIYRPKHNNAYGRDLSQVTWLPTQAQLQGMVYEIIQDDGLLLFWGHWIDRFDDWRNLPTEKDGLFFTSMEQLWLAFVMKEKYNNVWDGEGWIIKKDNNV